MSDLAVFSDDAFGAGRVLDGDSFGVVHDQGGLIVAERGDYPRAGEDLREGCEERRVGVGALDPAGRASQMMSSAM